MTADPIVLTTSRLTLRSPEEFFFESIPHYLQMNREFFKSWLPAHTEDYYSWKNQKKILKEDISRQQLGTQFRFYLFLYEQPDEIIGDITFSNIIRDPMQSCFLGYKLAQKVTGKGYMFEALESALQFIFNEIKLHRVEANIIPRNTPSIRLIEKLGFRNEGLSKEYLQINGVWEDHYRFAKLSAS